MPSTSSAVAVAVAVAVASGASTATRTGRRDARRTAATGLLATCRLNPWLEEVYVPNE
jgi:hypothetical protein